MNKNRTENYVDGEITEAKLDAALVAKVNGVGLNHTHTLSQIADAGNSAGLDVGTTAGTVAAGDHAHTDLAPLASPTFTGTVTGTFSGNLTGNVTGTASGNLTSASTLDATKLDGTVADARLSANVPLKNAANVFKPASDSTTALQVQPSGSATPTLNVDTTNGRIGINKANPSYPLHLESDGGVTSGEHVLGTMRRDGNGGGIVFGYRAASSTASAGFIRSSLGGVDFWLGTPSYPGAIVINGATGNVGLGSLAPTYSLHIAPTSGATAGQTLFVQDATATTGKTGVVVKAGAANVASDALLQVQASNGTVGLSIPYVIRDAANDAAAAALTPAVPLGGLYRNGSVLMVRVA